MVHPHWESHTFHSYIKPLEFSKSDIHIYMTVFTITLFTYMNMLHSNTIYVLIYSKQYMRGYALHVAIFFHRNNILQEYYLSLNLLQIIHVLICTACNCIFCDRTIIINARLYSNRIFTLYSKQYIHGCALSVTIFS